MMSLDTSPADESGYLRIRHWLNERCGIYYQERKKQMLMHRMQRVCQRHGISDLTVLADHIESGRSPSLQRQVMDAASTNHTYFFREPQVLDFFRDTILPTLPQSHVRLWSAAASSGDEAYTLAIMACQSRGQHWSRANLAILGTDISETMIAQAEAGVFGSAHLERVPAPVLRQYFEPAGLDQYRVCEELRQMCTFRRLNLKASAYPFQNGFHVVFCRNVLYYFDPAHQQAILETIYDATEPGGWLLTSVTESLRSLDTRWVPVHGGVYRKAG